MAELEAGAGHGTLKGEAATEQEANHVVLHLVQHVGRFAGVLDAIAVDPVTRSVGAQVGARGVFGGFEVAGRCAFEQGAGDGIGLAEGLEILG